ncbi:hypothetical protein ACHAWO_000726 [Cyclotella atomus]|jgi:hypothetical protein|uniref:Cyclin-like domain-containing protein n=1 Tax=Cyclotella atomus TaxID=382360 RepID=A0ABD3PFZ0_9STRA
MININEADIMQCIAAMHLQEQKTPRCINYFQRTTVVDESSRAAMVNWLCQISDALSLNRETVGFAMSLLDRYLSTNTNGAKQALADKHKFQLAAITTYYIAVKINEPVQLGVDMLVKLCRGFYESSAIVSMEQDILFSLEWRISAPTPLDFMRQILRLLPTSERCIGENAEMHIANVTKDSHFSAFAPSLVGAACVAMAFRESNVTASTEQVLLWDMICNTLELDTSYDFLGVQQQLQSKSTKKPTPIGRAITTLTRRSSYIHLGDSSSPVSVNV